MTTAFHHLILPSLLIISFLAHHPFAIPLDLCSSSNIGTFQQNDQYMSTGLCHDDCLSQGYVIAILNQHNCYCSNDVPADTTDLSNCNQGCPGIDTEHCGGSGYYGYLVLGNPSATVGAGYTSTSEDETSTSNTFVASTSTTSTSTTTTPTTSNTPTTLITRTTQITQTHKSSNVVQITEYTTEVVQPSTTSSSSSSSSNSSPSSSSSSNLVTTTVQPSTVYSIMTVNGTQTQEVRTMFITQLPSTQSNTSLSSSMTSNFSSQTESTSSTPPATSSSTLSNADNTNSSNTSSNKSTFFDDKGKVAGTFTAVGIVVLGIVSAFFYCCCCCRGSSDNDNGFMTDEENQYSSDDTSINHEKIIVTEPNKLSKNSSFNSSLQRNNSSSKSLFTYFTGGITNNNNSSDLNRSSSRKKLMSKNSSTKVNNHDEIMFPIDENDSRLDPSTMFMNTNSSYKSLGDDHDYSRKLKITNPDNR